MKIVTWIAFWILLIFATVVISFELQGILLGSQLLQQHPYMQYLCRMLLIQDICGIGPAQSSKSQLQSLLIHSHTQQQYDRISQYMDISTLDEPVELLSLYHVWSGVVTDQVDPDVKLVLVYDDLYGKQQRQDARIDMVHGTRSFTLGKHNRMMQSGRNRYSFQLFKAGEQLASYDVSLYAPIQTIRIGSHILYLNTEYAETTLAGTNLLTSVSPTTDAMMLTLGCIETSDYKVIVSSGIGVHIVPGCLLYSRKEGYLFLIQKHGYEQSHERIDADITDIYGNIMVSHIPLYRQHEGLLYQSLVAYDPVYEVFDIYYYERIEDTQRMYHHRYDVSGRQLLDLRINIDTSILQLRNQYQSYQLGIDPTVGRYGRLEEQVVQRFTAPMTPIFDTLDTRAQTSGTGMQYWIEDDMIYITNGQQQGRIWIDDMRQQWRGVKE